MPLVSLVVVSLFTKLLAEEVLQVIGNRLNMDASFSDHSPLLVEDIMKLFDICLKVMYFQFEDKFCQQKEGMATGSSLSVDNLAKFYCQLVQFNVSTMDGPADIEMKFRFTPHPR
jgi:hypothetical protein